MKKWLGGAGQPRSGSQVKKFDNGDMIVGEWVSFIRLLASFILRAPPI